MKILTTIYNLENLNDLLEFSSGFLIGNDDFGTRLTMSFTSSEICKALRIANALGKKAFLVANQIFTDEQLTKFRSFIEKLTTDKLTGIIISDLGAYRILISLGLEKKIVYNPETLLTNTYDFNFLAKKGVLGAYVAKELTLIDILDIGKNKQYAMFIVAHGHLSMFYSKRHLIDTYTAHNEIENKFHNRQDLKLIEEHRVDNPYPILEDKAGTHVFRSQVLNSFSFLKDLETVIDYFVIDTIFKDDRYAIKIVKMYNEAKLDYSVKAEIEEQYNESWDEGFYLKKTIYKQKGKNND